MRQVTPEDLVDTVIAADDLRRKARGLSSTRAAASLTGTNHPGNAFLSNPYLICSDRSGASSCFSCPVCSASPTFNGSPAMGAYRPGLENPELAAILRKESRTAGKNQKVACPGPENQNRPVAGAPHPHLSPRYGRASAMAAFRTFAPRAADRRCGGGRAKAGRVVCVHPKCFLAIDPFALDTVSVPVGAFYGAWMHRIYLAWDRQPSTQSWIQRNLLLRQTGYDRILAASPDLKADIPVVMVLSGGLPYNARLPLRRPRICSAAAGKTVESPEAPGSKGTDGNPDDAGRRSLAGGQGEIPPGKRKAILEAFLRWGLRGRTDGEPALKELVGRI